jgi:hypothetical protein
MGTGRILRGTGIQETHFWGSDNRPDLNLCAVDLCEHGPAWACSDRAGDAAADLATPAIQTHTMSAQSSHLTKD